MLGEETPLDWKFHQNHEKLRRSIYQEKEIQCRQNDSTEESPTAAAAVLTEDPHTVLVEFSSVVADTQEYIIEVGGGLPGWDEAWGGQG